MELYFHTGHVRNPAGKRVKQKRKTLKLPNFSNFVEIAAVLIYEEFNHRHHRLVVSKSAKHQYLLKKSRANCDFLQEVRVVSGLK
jgi:hypothetical protein